MQNKRCPVLTTFHGYQYGAILIIRNPHALYS